MPPDKTPKKTKPKKPQRAPRKKDPAKIKQRSYQEKTIPADLEKRQGEVWEKLDEETPRNYQYFLHYRDQDPLKRSMRNVAVKYNVNESYVGTLSRRYHWVKRVEQWDAFNAEVSTLAVVNEHIETRKYHATIARDALELLHIPIQKLKERMQKNAKAMQELESMSLTDAFALARNSARIYSKLVEVERLAKGLTSKDIGVRSQDEMFHKLLEELESEFKDLDEHGARELIRKSEKPHHKGPAKTRS